MGRKLYAKIRLDEEKLHTRHQSVALERARWASGQRDVNPIVIRSAKMYMQPVDGVKVTCLTLGELRALPLAGKAERLLYRDAAVSRSHSTRLSGEGRNTRTNRCQTLDERWRGRMQPEMAGSLEEVGDGIAEATLERLKLSRRARRNTGEG